MGADPDQPAPSARATARSIGQVPGGITRWMAVPWQTDTASCRSGYETTYDPYVPTFWPARVPNQVLTRENYAIVMDAEADRMAERLAAFANRAAWLAPLGTAQLCRPDQQHDRRLRPPGRRRGPPGPTDPADQALSPRTSRWRTSTSRSPDRRQAAAALHGLPACRGEGQTDLVGIDKVRRFPHGLRR